MTVLFARLSTRGLAQLVAVAGAAALVALSLLLTLPSDATIDGRTGAGTDAAAASEPVRVAVLVPYVARALEQMPAGRARVVAAVAPSGGTLPAGAIDLGSPHSPSYELLAQARPDLVVGNDRLHASLRERLGRSGADVLLVGGSSVEATLDGLEVVGDRVGVGGAMRGRTAEARQVLEELRLGRPVEVLPLFGAPGAFLAVTRSTWLGDLLDQLGFTNPVTAGGGRETFPGYVQLADEVLVSLDPDRVLLVTHGEPEAVREAFRRQAAAGGPWGHLAEQAVVLEPALFGDNPGLELPEAARRLVELAREIEGEARRSR